MVGTGVYRQYEVHLSQMVNMVADLLFRGYITKAP